MVALMTVPAPDRGVGVVDRGRRVVCVTVAGDTEAIAALEASTECGRKGSVRGVDEASRRELVAIDVALIVVSIRYGDDGDQEKKEQRRCIKKKCWIRVRCAISFELPADPKICLCAVLCCDVKPWQCL